jgi:hypothetical protein
MSTNKTNNPLELRLINHQSTYHLNLSGQTGEEFRRQLEQLRQAPPGWISLDTAPEPPTVDLDLEIHNNSTSETEIWLGGDEVELTLELTGPGAVTLPIGGPFLTHIVVSEPITIAPGASHVIHLTHLRHGFRDYSAATYWTEPGEYTLTANFQLGRPPGTPENEHGEPHGPWLSSEPVRIQVTA